MDLRKINFLQERGRNRLNNIRVRRLPRRNTVRITRILDLRDPTRYLVLATGVMVLFTVSILTVLVYVVTMVN